MLDVLKREPGTINQNWIACTHINNKLFAYHTIDNLIPGASKTKLSITYA